MNEWQAWVAVFVGFVVSKIGWDQRQDKVRTDKFRDDMVEKVAKLAERVVRVESEIVTEREVREILHELIVPVTTGLNRLESKQDAVTDALVEIKLALATVPKRKEEH